MVMPISFLDVLDSRRTLKGYKDPKSSEASSGTQTPALKGTERAEAEKADRQAAGNVAAQGKRPSRP